MAIISHEEDVKIVKLNPDTVLEDRSAILNSANEENSPTIVTIMFAPPSTGGLKTYGDCEIIELNNKEGDTTGYKAILSAYYKGTILPEAMKLALKEMFGWFNKNKIKPDIIYVITANYQLSKLEFINLTLIIQNSMKDCKLTASLWMEEIETVDINSLSMDTETKIKAKDKDKKKKKKNKKKGK